MSSMPRSAAATPSPASHGAVKAGTPKSQGEKCGPVKQSHEKRIRRLVRERNEWRARAQEHEAELLRLRPIAAKREAAKREMPERITKAREQGRKLFQDFDAVVTGVPVDREVFQALIASANGPELMYAAGLGLKVMALYRDFQRQSESEQQQIAYYRELSRRAFLRSKKRDGR